MIPATDQMHETTQQRYWALLDAVFEKLAVADVLGLLEVAGNMANDSDYVDAQMVERFRRAVDIWAPQ